MINQLITKLAGRPLATTVVSGGVVRDAGTSLSAAACAQLSVAAFRGSVSERPIQAPVEATVTAGSTFDAYDTTTGAGHQIFGQQNTQLHTMWALRGLDPWSDPA
ncbi:hypothetical protein [Streptomyces avicenniae]|uniref:hypothetical protein n=1 Tax=Streptomyces avicenniae TaxID=500153 RepID=UPI0006998919|nr:hypothetical protein [Streptomyces avicenniae]